MSNRSFLGDTISDYVRALSEPPDEVQTALITATIAATGGSASMQIGSDQGAFMSILTAVLQPRFAVEVGTFTGYSALAVARALPTDGRLLCCDVSEEWTSIARVHWELAGVADRIELVIAPAIETLSNLPDDPPIDLAFIDADKVAYVDYHEAILPRLSDRGVILVDNTLWSGTVADPAVTEESAVALRAFNDHVLADPRSEVALLSIGDGVTIIRRR